MKINQELKRFIEDNIIPRYAHFDKAHQESHVRTVIEQSLYLSQFYNVDPNMVLVAAAYHDLGLAEGREFHHLVSGRIVREDKQLRKWFDEKQIETIACAAEDHRASNKHEPRGIYSKIVAEADRIIDGETIVRRTIQFGFSHYPELDKEGNYGRFLEHLKEKYAEGGYLKLWIPESPNNKRLKEFQAIIKDEAKLRAMFDRIYSALTDEDNSHK